MASKAQRATAALATARRKNESLEKAISAVKRAAKDEMTQRLTVGALSAGGGAIAGSKLQEYLNTKAAESGKLDAYSASISKIPTGVFIGGALAAFALAKMKGKAQAAVAGLGAGMAGGSYLEGPPAGL